MDNTYTIVYPDGKGAAGQVLKINEEVNTQCKLIWSNVDTAPRIEHAQTLAAGFTVADNSNAALIGDVAIASGQTIQVGANSVLKIL